MKIFRSLLSRWTCWLTFLSLLIIVDDYVQWDNKHLGLFLTGPINSQLHFDYGDPVDIYIHYAVHLLTWAVIGLILDGLTNYIRNWRKQNRNEATSPQKKPQR